MRIAIAIVILVVTLGGIFLLTSSPGEKITTFAVYESGGDFAVNFQNPTPAHDAVLNAETIIINASTAETLTSAKLEWDGANYSMTSTGTYWSITKSGSGTFLYKVYGLTANQSAFSETRRIYLSYVAIDTINNATTNEDTPFASINLSANKAVSYSFSLSRTDYIDCTITSNTLSCTPKANQIGATTVTVTADDGIVTDIATFTLTILPQNDLPTVAAQINSKKFTNNQKIKIKLYDYFTDADSTLTYKIATKWSDGSNASAAFIFNITNNELLIIPKSVGKFIANITASDGEDETSQIFEMNVTENNPPILTGRSSEIIMASNAILPVDLENYFDDPDNDPLLFNTSGTEDMATPISDEILFLNPHKDFVGKRTLTVTADDGMVKVPLTLQITVGEAEVTTVTTTPTTETTEEIETNDFGTNSLSPMKWDEDNPYTLTITDFIDLSFTENIVVTVTGLDKIKHEFSFPTLTLTPEENFIGEEVASITVKEGGNIQKLLIPISIINADDDAPELMKALPQFEFNENQTNVTIDLAEYYYDPDGDAIQFEVWGSDNIEAEMLSASIVVFSLAGSADAGTQDIKILAKDANGNIKEDNVIITIAQAIKKDSAWLIVLMQIIVLGVLITIGYLGYDRYILKKPARNQSIRVTKKIDFPEKIKTHHKDFPKIFNALQKNPEEKTNKPTFDAISGLPNAITKLFKQEELHEPKGWRMESMYIKESISTLKALISSTNDDLTKAALEKERAQLFKAYHVLVEMDPIDKDSVRKLLLYIKESYAALGQIMDINQDGLIRKEVEREIDRLKVVESHIDFKLSQL